MLLDIVYGLRIQNTYVTEIKCPTNNQPQTSTRISKECVEKWTWA